MTGAFMAALLYVLGAISWMVLGFMAVKVFIGKVSS